MAQAAAERSDIHRRPVELLRRLIRFDTTNPPGNERECISYLEGLLAATGLETTIRARAPERPNLVARLPGRGDAPPLLLQGHVDVVTTEGQQWAHPPFEGIVEDGCVWGRGAVDMKGGVAMMLAAVLRAREAGLVPAGDVVFCALSDEEAFGGYGARYMVEEHPELFEGCRYALGEFGAFSLAIAGRTFYPIQVAEKQLCSLKATVRGPGGHGALPVRRGAIARLAKMLRDIDRSQLPVHVTPVVRETFRTAAAALPVAGRMLARGLVTPALTDRLLRLLGERANNLYPILHNTVSPTILRASEKVNVIPAEVSALIDGRLLPGFGPEDLLRELRAVVGGDVELEVTLHEPYPAEPDLGMFDTLAGILRELDPASVPLPHLMAGVTDGRFFARLGIQTYGFLPMKLPAGFDFWKTVHAANERVPADALEFGTTAIQRALERFPGD
jgi:acetylornithine deacetylase/succinyl-diaminopimelate desuccinylase-like protein